MPSQRREFTARFLLATNDETGEEFILQSDAEIAQAIAVMEADHDQKLEEFKLGGTGDDAIRKMKSNFEAQLTALRNRLIRDRDAAKPDAESFEYTLRKPDYGEWLRIRAEANQMDPNTGVASFDEALYCDLLLKNDGVKAQDGKILSAADIESLPPRVAQELGTRLALSMEPNRKRLPFTSRRSDPV